MMDHTPIQVRDRRFALDAARVPRHWFAGRRAVTRFFDGLSIFFPAGERFFVAAVRAHEREVHDPALREDIRAFALQEGVHTREHVRYNDMLAAQGLPAAAMEARVKRLLSAVTKNASKQQRLAVTCALEHFTVLLGHVVLEEGGLDGADPEMAALWRFHAMEEDEHKAVAFDVYRATFGNYPTRALVMIAATLVFWGKVLEHQARLMQADGIATDAREWLDLASFLFVSPGPLRRLARPYLAYFAPGFHPNDLKACPQIALTTRFHV